MKHHTSNSIQQSTKQPVALPTLVFALLLAGLVSSPVRSAPVVVGKSAGIVGDAKGKSNKLPAEQAKPIAVAFLPRTGVPLKQKGFQSWGTVLGEGLKCYHFEGPQDEYLSIDVDTTSGEVRSYQWEGLKVRSQTLSLTMQQAQAKVDAFLKVRVDVLKNPNISQKRAKYFDHHAIGKEYSFEWRKTINDVQYPFGMVAQVSAQSGDVVGYFITENKVTLASLVPGLSKEEIIALAKPIIALEPGYTVEANLIIGLPTGKQQLLWQITAKGTKVWPYDPDYGQSSSGVSVHLEMDATTGKVEINLADADESRPVVQLRPPAHPSTYTTVDAHPLLSTNVARPLYFVSSGSMDGYRTSIASARGKQLGTLFDAPNVVDSYDWAEPTKRLAFGMSNTLYVLDLKSGTLGQCNDSERVRRTMPSWNNTGHLLAMSGTHSPSDLVGTDDRDIFVALIADELSRVSMRQHWCLSVLPGDDILPVFAPDGKQVAFAHQDVSKQADGTYQPVEAQTWSLYLADASKPKGWDEGKTEYAAPHKILGGLQRPERLSWFPDGKRLLVSYVGNEYEMKNPPQIVDIDAKTSSEWKWPVLHDPDLPGSKPLLVREPSVSPDGKRIAFRALRWTGDQKDAGAICIYTCAIDGSALSRLTPPTKEPLTPLVYPRAGVTALNAWAKLEPQRNLGTLMTPEQIKAEQRIKNPSPPVPFQTLPKK